MTDANSQEEKAESVSPHKHVKGSLRLDYVMVGMIFSAVRLDDEYARYSFFSSLRSSFHVWFWVSEVYYFLNFLHSEILDEGCA